MACCVSSPLLPCDCGFESPVIQLPALSIKQPMASLVVFGLKGLEIRSRPTKVRGRVIVCASLKPYVDPMLDPDNPGLILNDARQYIDRMGELALYGQAIGMIDIVGCRLMTPDDEQRALIEYIPGTYAWELANPTEIEPFPVTGQLSFFKIPANKVIVKCGLHC